MSQRPDISARRTATLPRVRRRRAAVARLVGRWVVATIAAAVAVGHVADVHSTGEAAPARQQTAPDFAMRPCRLGSTTVRGGDVVSVPITGANRACPIPPTATRVTLVVTAANGTAASSLTVSTGGAARSSARPDARWFAGQQPTSTEITAELGPDGHVELTHATGTVDLAIDVVGYST